MGDIGAADQLISAREENKVLKAKVEELKEKVKDLTLTNAQLLAEVEMYRKDAALPSFSNMALGQSNEPMSTEDDKSLSHAFVSSGNGTYPSDAAVSLPHLNHSSNPLCCALNKSDTVIASGGADGYISLVAWGAALNPNNPNAAAETVAKAARVKCNAPVICVSFANHDNIVAAGCMDGSVQFIGYNVIRGAVQAWVLQIKAGDGHGDGDGDGKPIKYTKYVKSMSWSPSSDLLATTSADGTVSVSKVSLINSDFNTSDGDQCMEGTEDACKEIALKQLKSLHFNGAVEAVCFVSDGDSLCLHVRDTSHLAYFDLKEDYAMSAHSLNGAVTGGFDSHVSFTVMQLSLSPNGKYLCAATDNSRNIIIEVGTSNIVRDLYGHKNDGFSQPRIAWSSSGQYIFGNTQENSDICVWDIASSKMVKRLNGHTGQLRDMFSSKTGDTVVTASYDKTVKVWLNEM